MTEPEETVHRTIADVRAEEVEIPTDFDDGRNPDYPNDWDPDDNKESAA